MPLNHYLTLGRSGLRVSPFCLGTMTFGEDWGWGSSVEDSQRILDAYTDRGGNFIDTANIYTKGHSEQIIGEHIGRHPAKRDRLVIATKFLGNLYRGDPNGGGAGRKSMLAACEQSLRRLQTDSIDLYWMHFWDHLTPIEETLRAMDDLVKRRQGPLLRLQRHTPPGSAASWPSTLAACRALRRPCVALQIEYSLVQRSCRERA
jgi:aryl-alcohol dehydrogenase-like predicted oxidoreductase